jgi:hypothetical protein
MAVTPRTNPILAILDPTTLPNAKSGLPSIAAMTLTNNSGTEVAKDTTVRPTIILDIFSFSEIETEDLTRNSPPTTRKLTPRNNSK